MNLKSVSIIMGIPGFFSWLKRNIDQNILSKNIFHCNYLFLDANGLFHPACLKLATSITEENIEQIEKQMIQSIKDSITKVITYTKATKIYICVDGVAPLAKVKQQRLRRYKSIKERNFFDSLKKKYNKEVKENVWTNVAITPGTTFMKKITKELTIWCKEKNYFFFSADTPGEGEHKILHLLKSISFSPTDKIGIHGLDADLLFLMASVNQKNIFLIREENENHFIIVRMDYVKKYLHKDFMVMCFLAGNDFIPHLPSIDIYKRGMYYLSDVLNSLQIKNLIRTENFLLFLKELHKREKDIFKTMYKTRRIQTSSGNTYEEEEYIYKNVLYVGEEQDPIQLGKEFDEVHFKYRYYKNYCHAFLDQEEIIYKMCYTYLKTIYWVYKYYTDKCISWTWYYPFDVAPFTSDLIQFIEQTHFSFEKLTFQKDQPISQEEQLICVIPKDYKFLLPKHLHSLYEKYSYMFPDDYKEDTYNKTKHYKCNPILPEFHFRKIKSFFLTNK